MDVRQTTGVGRAVRRLGTDGTLVIAIGSVAAGVAAYAFQVMGGRALGEQGFAPVAAILSVHSFLLAVVLTAVELLTVRSTVLSMKASITRSIQLTVAFAFVAMAVFTISGRDRYLGGSLAYLPAGLAVVATHAVFAVGRGRLAGHGRNVAYGLVSASASVVRFALALVLLAVTTHALPLVWAVAAGPVVILAFSPWARREREPSGEVGGEGSFMVGLLLAGAVSEALVLLAPVVGGALESVPGQTGTVVSVLFVTFSLGRAPLAITQNLASRLLAGLTRLVAAEEDDQVRWWSRRLLFVALVAAPVAGAVGWWIGPGLVRVLFGEGFVPTPMVAGLAGGASGAAAFSVLVNQVLVATGRTGRLGMAWLIGMVAAAIGIVVVPGDAAVRTAAAVAIGEVVAIVAVGLAGAVEGLSLVGRHGKAYDTVKRVIDVVVAAVLLVALAPITLLAAAAVHLEGGGAAFLRQRRVGRGGRAFWMWKLRTMGDAVDEDAFVDHLREVAREGPVVPDPTGDGRPLYHGDDPRVTSIGRLLRRSSLDEIPNLINVIAGHMSLVGPRPLVPEEAALLGPVADRRHEVRPGMTGLAQTQGRRAMTYETRAFWDIEYVKRRGALLDLTIVLRTIEAVVGVSRTNR